MQKSELINKFKVGDVVHYVGEDTNSISRCDFTVTAIEWAASLGRVELTFDGKPGWDLYHGWNAEFWDFSRPTYWKRFYEQIKTKDRAGLGV